MRCPADSKGLRRSLREALGFLAAPVNAVADVGVRVGDRGRRFAAPLSSPLACSNRFLELRAKGNRECSRGWKTRTVYHFTYAVSKFRCSSTARILFLRQVASVGPCHGQSTSPPPPSPPRSTPRSRDTRAGFRGVLPETSRLSSEDVQDLGEISDRPQGDLLQPSMKCPEDTKGASAVPARSQWFAGSTCECRGRCGRARGGREGGMQVACVGTCQGLQLGCVGLAFGRNSLSFSMRACLPLGALLCFFSVSFPFYT